MITSLFVKLLAICLMCALIGGASPGNTILDQLTLALLIIPFIIGGICYLYQHCYGNQHNEHNGNVHSGNGNGSAPVVVTAADAVPAMHGDVAISPTSSTNNNDNNMSDDAAIASSRSLSLSSLPETKRS
jgi:hypothetical protein